jgi:hypothetical protein
MINTSAKLLFVVFILNAFYFTMFKYLSVTYFGVFNFGTSYLGAKIGQNKTMTKIS